MTSPEELIAPTVPDFQADAEAVAAYDDARVSYLSRQATEAEERTRTSFAKRRAAIREEIDTTAALQEGRKAMAEEALWQYALRYPLRVVDDTPSRPSFWEAFWSFGFASRMYQRAIVTAAEVAHAKSRRRRLEQSEEELEHQLQRALYLQEEARKKSLEQPDGGLAAFHEQPAIAALRTRVEEINAERARFAARLAAGEVSHVELRDREFAQERIVRLGAPCDGVTIVRVTGYGPLTYFILRDLESKLYALAYDPRLEALIDFVVDVYWLVDAFCVRATSAPTGWPMTIAEHYATNFKDPEDARYAYRTERTALGAARMDVPPMTFRQSLDGQNDEARLIHILATFAETLPQGTPDDASAEQ